MTKHIPEGVTPEMLKELLDSPGSTISNGGNTTPAEVRTATRSVDVSQPARKGIRPAISGNEATDHTGERITVSPNLARKLADGDAKMRAVSAKQCADEQERVELTDIDRIIARISFLERSNKKLQSEVNKLKNSND